VVHHRKRRKDCPSTNKFIDRNAAREGLEPTPKLKEESPLERMLPSGVHPGGDQANEITALEVEGMESDGNLDKKQLRSKRRSNSVKVTIGSILLAFVLFVVIDTSTNGYVKNGIDVFFEWVEVHPTRGFFSFVFGKCGNSWFCLFVTSAVGMVLNYTIRF
jgi:hypothetical protein